MTKAKQSLFEQARRAKSRTETYRIPLVDRAEADRIWAALTEATQRARMVSILDSEKAEQDEADADVARIQAEFDAAFQTVTFRGLPAVDMDALVNAHPDPAEGEEPDDDVPFIYYLAEASCVGNGADTTAAQWQELCEKHWAVAEAGALRQAVLDANQQPYSVGLGKG